jgi:transcription antitermination factor NusG
MIHPSIWSSTCSPTWVVAFVPPQGELTATAWLARQCVEAWHPVEVVYVHAPRPPHKMVPRIKPIAAGYLFVKIDRLPIRDFWIAQSNGKIRDILHFGERLVMIGDDAMLQMRQVPERLRDMRAAAEEAKRIKPGDTVTILAGSMAGWQMTVEASDNGVVRLASPVGVIEVEREKVAK